MEFAPKTLMDSHVIALMVTMDIQIVLRVLVAVILIHPQAATRKMVNVIATKALMELFAINVPTDTLGSLTVTVSLYYIFLLLYLFNLFERSEFCACNFAMRTICYCFINRS